MYAITGLPDAYGGTLNSWVRFAGSCTWSRTFGEDCGGIWETITIVISEHTITLTATPFDLATYDIYEWEKDFGEAPDCCGFSSGNSQVLPQTQGDSGDCVIWCTDWDCKATCTNCTGTVPRQIQLVLPTMYDWLCSNCDQVAGTYVLTLREDLCSDDECSWQYDLDRVCLYDGTPPAGQSAYIRVTKTSATQVTVDLHTAFGLGSHTGTITGDCADWSSEEIICYPSYYPCYVHNNPLQGADWFSIFLSAVA